MKKLVIASLSLLFAVSVFAQKQGSSSPEEQAKKRTEHMATALSLTEQQTKSVEAINLDFAKQRAEVQHGNHDAKVALKDAYDKQLAAVLTPEQMKKAEEMRSEGKGKKKHGHGKGNPNN